MNNENETTYILSGTVIHGSIVSSDNIMIEGCVEGDIVSEKDVNVYGGSTGGIKAQNVHVKDATVQGELYVADTVLISHESNVNGPIRATDIKIKGNVVGNIKADNRLNLFSTALVKGNIQANKVTMEEGAIFRGDMRISK